MTFRVLVVQSTIKISKLPSPSEISVQNAVIYGRLNKNRARHGLSAGILKHQPRPSIPREALTGVLLSTAIHKH